MPIEERFTAFAHPLSVDEGLKGLALVRDPGAHVEQLMLQVLLTEPGERINRPRFGCGLRSMVFAPGGDAVASLAEVTVYQALETWLGDVVEAERVEVRAAGEALEVRIAYLIKARRERRYLNLEVTL